MLVVPRPPAIVVFVSKFAAPFQFIRSRNRFCLECLLREIPFAELFFEIPKVLEYLWVANPGPSPHDPRCLLARVFEWPGRGRAAAWCAAGPHCSLVWVASGMYVAQRPAHNAASCPPLLMGQRTRCTPPQRPVCWLWPAPTPLATDSYGLASSAPGAPLLPLAG